MRHPCFRDVGGASRAITWGVNHEGAHVRSGYRRAGFGVAARWSLPRALLHFARQSR